MKITHEVLTQRSIPEDQRAAFVAAFPNGVEILPGTDPDPAVVRRVGEAGVDLSPLVDDAARGAILASATRAYETAVEAADRVFDEAAMSVGYPYGTTPAEWSAYEQSLAPAQYAYREACARGAWQGYFEAIAAATWRVLAS